MKLSKELGAHLNLNGICAYFTMFPLDFPYQILKEYGKMGEKVLDPFCGRGTTNYASRLVGLSSIGIDNHPLAVAVSEAKLVSSKPTKITRIAERILDRTQLEESDVPKGDFWETAYHPQVLQELCKLRKALLQNCDSAGRKALRAVILGALHGPLRKTEPDYFSNQMPRTFAPKPNYSVKYWKEHNLQPPRIDVLKLIKKRSERYYSDIPLLASGNILKGDSRELKTFKKIEGVDVDWIITSPPYYGMTTYIPDQWLRLWFLGGKATVDYSNKGQLAHNSQSHFAGELNKVWRNISIVAKPEAKMVIRFGAINNRKLEPKTIIERSVVDSGWEIYEVNSAGLATMGRRQALHFSKNNQNSIEEYDFWLRKVL